MARPQAGDTVRLHYTGYLDDGRVFASSMGQTPLEVTVGEGKLIPTLESAIAEMNLGEERTVTIPAERAYGLRDPELVVSVDREEFPREIEPQVGQQLQLRQSNGQTMVVRVADVSEEQITIDANHPLAGENLTFRLHLLDSGEE